MVDEALTLLVAGSDTTATALAWSLDALARHPRVARAVRREAADGARTYTAAVVRETLRLHPVVPLVS